VFRSDCVQLLTPSTNEQNVGGRLGWYESGTPLSAMMRL
jgi:hypothetical protein